MSADVAWELTFQEIQRPVSFPVNCITFLKSNRLTPVLKVLQFIEENTDARIYILCEKL
jgi:hypothetical protein